MDPAVASSCITPRIYLLFFCLPLILSFAATSYGADWEYYGLDQDVNFLYFDKKAMHEEGGVVQVWQKKVFHSDNLFRIRQILGERYYKLIEKLTLYEIHCLTRTSQERAFVYYDNNGTVIDSRYFEFVRDWKKIAPNTDMARLYWICCRSEEKK
jgi:Surface-adhesin protein E